jgi:Uma2 family endonuclease
LITPLLYNDGEKMVQTPLKCLTLEAFLALPETKPASEFIAGQIVQKPMPKGKHSTIQSDLGAVVNTRHLEKLKFPSE